MKSKITKGVILAGGKGTRLLPLTRVTNKHLLPVYDRPMITYPIEILRRAGISDIMIVTGRGHAGHFVELLESGQAYGVNLRYAVQEEAGGIAQALQHAEAFCEDERFVAMLGDNLFDYEIGPTVNRFASSQAEAGIFLKEVSDPRPYGIAVIEDDKVSQIIEKPQDPPSNLAVVGLYLYTPDVFLIAKTLTPSARGELEITDINNHYLQKGTLTHEIMDGWWGDAGESHQSLLEAANYIAKKKQV